MIFRTSMMVLAVAGFLSACDGKTTKKDAAITFDSGVPQVTKDGGATTAQTILGGELMPPTTDLESELLPPSDTSLAPGLVPPGSL